MKIEEICQEELSFHKLIDQARSIIPIFADWLGDRGDSREEG